MEKWFGVVRWCREDVENAVRERGLEVDPDFVDTVVANCMRNHHFTDAMIQAGWDTIDSYIDDELTKNNSAVLTD